MLDDGFLAVGRDGHDLSVHVVGSLVRFGAARGERDGRSDDKNDAGAACNLVYMVWVGTSGYNYPEWKGSFYPADLAAAKMLPYYAARFPTVEINYTFYRMPTEKLVAGWAAQTPSPYQADAQGAASNHARQPAEGLRRARWRRFCDVAATLGDKLGTLLFQLPPFLRKDVALLDAFLPQLPAGSPRGLRVSSRVVVRR